MLPLLLLLLGAEEVCGDDSGPRARAFETIESVRLGATAIPVSALLPLASPVMESDVSSPAFPAPRVLGLLDPLPPSALLAVEARLAAASGGIVSGEAIRLASVRGSVVDDGVVVTGTTLQSL